ncbi:MAG: hypothetical protein V9G24_17815 [Rhodoblastus sp.]
MNFAEAGERSTVAAVTATPEAMSRAAERAPMRPVACDGAGPARTGASAAAA